MGAEETIDACADLRRQCQDFAGQRAAQADPVRRSWRIAGIGLDIDSPAWSSTIATGRRQIAARRVAEARDVAVDDGDAEIGLGREVIVDAGLADAEAVGDVLVAEGAVAAGLDQRLGEIEDLLGGL